MLTTRCSVTKGSLTPFSKQESRYSFKNCNAWTVMRWDAWTTSRMVRCDAGSRTTQALFDGAMFIGRLRIHHVWANNLVMVRIEAGVGGMGSNPLNHQATKLNQLAKEFKQEAADQFQRTNSLHNSWLEQQDPVRTTNNLRSSSS
ncbi:hypothetical protein BASA81_003323 [Batrachochytrium salamandrivorans]|nr:hypothetical protein BASA81_003323 [Batrachochytrium salamandrivorans]